MSILLFSLPESVPGCLTLVASSYQSHGESVCRTCLMHPEEHLYCHHLKSTVIKPNKTSLSKRPSKGPKKRIMSRFSTIFTFEKAAIQTSNGRSLCNRQREAGTIRLKTDFIFWLRILQYTKVVYFHCHCQNDHETESETR